MIEMPKPVNAKPAMTEEQQPRVKAITFHVLRFASSCIAPVCTSLQ